MKSFVSPSAALVTFLACALNAAPTYAQTPAATPTPVANAPATPAAPADLTKDGQPKAKMVRQQCRSEVDGQGLKGIDKQKAISACVIKQRPDLAAKEQCRLDGREKGLKKDGLKAFVQDCMKAKG